MEPGALGTLLATFALALALSSLFLLAGKRLLLALLPGERDRPHPMSLLNGGGYFVGLTAFLILFVAGSRLTGSARWGLWISLAALVLVSIAELVRKGGQPSWRDRLRFAVSFLLLVAAFSVTNAVCWIELDHPTPNLMSHSGSIHSGRYANYAIHVSRHDAIPYLAQNVGQSLLAACHLMLGVNAPLAALMAWVPVSLTALACLLFGLFRAHGLSPGWGASAAYFVLGCNIALSVVHVLVLDNGSPLGFAGYSDVVASAGTFLLAAVWCRGVLLGPTGLSWRAVLLPAILAAGWCWYAPQNVVIAGVALSITGLTWAWCHPRERWSFLGTFATAGALSVGTTLLAGSQLGTFLPHSKREDIGAQVYEVGSEVRVRPYLDYVFTHWTDLRKRNLSDYREHGGYDPRAVAAEPGKTRKQLTRGQVFFRRLVLFESHLWVSLRMFGFLVLGLLAMAWRLSRTPADDPDRARLSAWFAMALLCFLTGYAITFGLELGGFKWWLTRFMVPATVLGLAGFALALAPRGVSSWRRATLWSLLLLVGTVGPAVEFGRAFWMSCRAPTRTIVPCLNGIAKATGPF